MTAGALAAARSLGRRRAWEAANTRAAILLDWDDVQAVAARALSPEGRSVPELLRRYRRAGATHLSLPELSLNRLLAHGQLSVIQGPRTDRIYVQAQSAALADLLARELQARLPLIDARRGKSNTLSFAAALPAVAEVGLGFDPAHAELARQAGLAPLARPIGYSWVQPEMIERTLAQAAELGATIIAVQGTLIPGHEFHIQHTVQVMQRLGLTFGYFGQSRHQKGDWFLAKHLSAGGRVMLAHEFTPQELLDEDLHTAAYRWGNLAREAGVRLCSVRFFRILHAADPAESLEYVHQIAHALQHAGLSLLEPEAAPPQLPPLAQERASLAGVGLSAAGAAGLAADLLPLPAPVKLAGTLAGAAALSALPFVEPPPAPEQHHHDDHHHHHHHGDESHHHDHEHSHPHHHHHGPAPAATAYAQKGLALAASVAFPAAALTLRGPGEWCLLGQGAWLGAAGAASLAATTVDSDVLLGIEEFRGGGLDWLLPLGLAAFAGARVSDRSRWLLLPAALVAARALGKLPADVPARLDREHRHAHTHHLSAFQQKLGDAQMALSPRPLRKWTLLAPLGLAGAAGGGPLAPLFLLASAVGHSALLAGFRHGPRPLADTLRGRARGWAVGASLAAGLWLGGKLIK